jgi:hypothetical protein
MRGHVPRALVDLFPKGLTDCGQHEWRRADDGTDGCYHCVVGVRPHQPIDVPIDHEFRTGLVRRADRELGRPRWEPPAAEPPERRRAGERLFARVSSIGDAARRSARRLRSP